ncbi:hypothetical protein [Spiroplasma endosymbiont of Stenodema calcarata]|uniref:hypothetical protein n=1 Tax=Spiroplasma endosymbiont of Stenodema calcarata TaxID=3139328 RepID=UPI003CCAFC3C
MYENPVNTSWINLNDFRITLNNVSVYDFQTSENNRIITIKLGTKVNYNDSLLLQYSNQGTMVIDTSKLPYTPPIWIGINKYTFYWFWAYLYLDHNVLKKVDHYMKYLNNPDFLAALIALFRSITCFGPIVIPLALLIVASIMAWRSEDPVGYDHGSGVILKFIGPGLFPSLLVHISSQ